MLVSEKFRGQSPKKLIKLACRTINQPCLCILLHTPPFKYRSNNKVQTHMNEASMIGKNIKITIPHPDFPCRICLLNKKNVGTTDSPTKTIKYFPQFIFSSCNKVAKCILYLVLLQKEYLPILIRLPHKYLP